MGSAPVSNSAPPQTTPDVSPLIGYATAPPDPASGVRVTRDAHHIEVVVPPLASWRALSPGLAWSIVALVAILLWQSALTISDRRSAWREMMPSLVFHALGVAAIVVFAYVRLHRWVRFVVTADRFFLIRRVAGMSETVTSWPRDRILAATVAQGTGKLVLSILGQDTLELFVSNDRSAARQVAQTLETALHEPFAPLAVPGAPVERAGRRISPRARRAAIAGVYVVLAVLVVLMIFAPKAGQIALAVAVIAAVPLGIRYGTQRKDYYV